MRVSVALHSCQNLVLSVLFVLATLMGDIMVLICIFLIANDDVMPSLGLFGVSSRLLPIFKLGYFLSV